MQIHRESGPPVTVHDFGGSGNVLLFAPANGFHGLCYKPVASSFCASSAASSDSWVFTCSSMLVPPTDVLVSLAC